MDFSVRPAALTDLWALRQLWEAMETELAVSYPQRRATDPDEITRYLAAGLGDPFPSILCPLLESDGRPIGFACGQILTRPTGSPVNYGFLLWIYVEPAARGQGGGRALLRAMAEGFYRVPTLTHVQLVARVGDPQWALHGWTPITTEHMISIPHWIAQLAGNGQTTMEPAPDVHLVQ